MNQLIPASASKVLSVNVQLLDAALQYAARSWPIFPLHGITSAGCSCGKESCSKPGKHPRTKHGVKDAGTNETQIREWWRRHRNANIAVATGLPSGLVALDIDPRHGGDNSLVDLENLYGPLPKTVQSFTGGGGVHILFSHPRNGLTIRNTAGLGGHPGIDVRGDGGYIVSPPSLHISGRKYSWCKGATPEDIPLAPIPTKLLSFMLARSERSATCVPTSGVGADLTSGSHASYGWAALEAEVRSVRSSSEGTRNSTLNLAAFNLGQLIVAGLLSEEEVFHNLLQAARDAGLSEGEAVPTIRSGMRAGREHPRAATPTPAPSDKPAKIARFDPGRSSSKQRTAGTGEGDTGSLPVIDAGDGNLPHMAAETWSAVTRANDPPKWFRYGDLPSRLQRDDRKILIVRELNKDRMKYLLARVAKWIRITERGPREVHPPQSVVKDMLACPDPQLPTLMRIVEAPIFAPDGTLCVERGYHPSSRTYYAPAKGFALPSISDNPSTTEIERARSLLLDDLLVDFPFTSHAERANAIALALLPFVRDLIEGATPLHLFEKPSPGTGGTLLVEVLLYPALGHPVATMTEGRQEEEWRKRITAKLMQGPTAILIDNLRNALESSALSAAITTPTWEDRILGVSQIARVPVRCAWAATGNNPMVSNEIARRSVRIRLDAKMDQPWRRTEFKHPKLLKWVRENRADLVWALLTLGQAWLAAGRPQPAEPKSLGMFEEWALVVGGILSHASIEGFLGNLDEFYTDSDSEGSALRTFVNLWSDKHGDSPVGVSDLYQLVADNDLFDLGDGTDRSQRTRLGKLIGKQRDRQFGDRRIVAAGESGGSQRWRLVAASAANS